MKATILGYLTFIKENKRSIYTTLLFCNTVGFILLMNDANFISRVSVDYSPLAVRFMYFSPSIIPFTDILNFLEVSDCDINRLIVFYICLSNFFVILASRIHAVFLTGFMGFILRELYQIWYNSVYNLTPLYTSKLFSINAKLPIELQELI